MKTTLATTTKPSTRLQLRSRNLDFAANCCRQRQCHHRRPYAIEGGTKAWLRASAGRGRFTSHTRAGASVRIADNKTAEIAEWNYDLLPIELSALQEANYDLGLLGFNAEELAKLMDTGVNEGLTDPDEIPEPPDEAVTQPGDLWILGNHRLLCGNSSSPADLDRLLAGAAIHLVNTDPPYNVKVEPRSNNAIAAGLSSFTNDGAASRLKGGQGNAASFGVDHETGKPKHAATHKKLRAKDRPLANDFVSDEAFDQLLDDWFGNIARVLLPGRCFLHLGRLRQLR